MQSKKRDAKSLVFDRFTFILQEKAKPMQYGDIVEEYRQRYENRSRLPSRTQWGHFVSHHSNVIFSVKTKISRDYSITRYIHATHMTFIPAQKIGGEI